MDSILLASTQDSNLLTTILSVAKAVVLVVVGVNMLIIVHEWGHFIVARMCGVRCDKFYIWFDIFGWKLFKFKWGDTEFGLGVLPLGGYVKMLGQEDNPGRLREELERAKAAEADKLTDGKDSSAEPSSETAGQGVDIKAAEAALYDPQSYLSKSVPQRMAIISAGVFMNVVFALVLAVCAYGLGVYKIDSEIGQVAPGGAAWKADLRAGDQVVEIAGERISSFDKLREATMLGDIDDGVEIVVKRPGVAEPVRTVVEPDRDHRLPTIGISNPDTTTLYEEEPTWFGTPAANCSVPVQGGDTIVAVNGKPVDSGFEYHRQEVIHRNETMSLTVRRGGKSPEASPAEEITVDVAPRPMRHLGMTMDVGAIDAVQANSPAEKAGLKAGDKITAVDGKPLGNAFLLDEKLQRRLEAASTEPDAEPVTVALTLQGHADPVHVPIRPVDWLEEPLYGNEHMSVPSLGITVEVTRRVSELDEDSPAARAGIRPGDVVVAVTPVPPDKAKREKYKIPKDLTQPSDKIELIKNGKEEVSWSGIFYQLQRLLPGTSLELELQDGRSVTVDWVVDDQWHYPDRGFRFNPKETFVQAHSFSEALGYGVKETRNALAVVFKFLGKVGSLQVSPRMMGGPWTIVKIAYRCAEDSLSDLLIFLCVISANLAVINFLPIPVLDGGHIVFLAYEGIRGKPPSENVQVALSYAGLFLLLGLMVWVFGLDLGFISR